MSSYKVLLLLLLSIECLGPYNSILGLGGELRDHQIWSSLLLGHRKETASPGGLDCPSSHAFFLVVDLGLKWFPRDCSVETDIIEHNSVWVGFCEIDNFWITLLVFIFLYQGTTASGFQDYSFC